MSPLACIHTVGRFFRTHRYPLALLAICLLGFGLRVWNMDFDPYTDKVPITDDAEQKVRQAMRVTSGALTPHRYMQPYFLIYTTAAMIRLAGPVEQHRVGDLLDIVPLYMVAFSIGTLLLLAATARFVFRDRRIALLAGLLFAVAPVAVIGSKHFKEDTPLMFFTCLGVFLMLKLLTTQRPRLYAAIGLCTGVAIGVKYMGAFLLPFYVLTYIMCAVAGGKAAHLARRHRPAFLGGLLLVLVGFLLFNPFVLLQAGWFVDHLGKQIGYSGTGHHTGVSIQGVDQLWTFYLRHAVIPGLSLLVTVAAAAGIVVAIRARNRPACFLAAWAVAYYLVIESSPAKPFPFVARYLHPVYPALCVFAAVGLYRLYDTLAVRRLRRALAVAAIGVIVLIPLAKSVLLCRSLDHDTRFQATRWIDEHIEPGATICLDNIRFSPRPSREKFNVVDVWRLYGIPMFRLQNRSVDYVVVNSFKYGQFELGRANTSRARKAHGYYRNLFESAELVKEFRPRFPFLTIAYHNPVIRVYRVPKRTAHPPGKQAG